MERENRKVEYEVMATKSKPFKVVEESGKVIGGGGL